MPIIKKDEINKDEELVKTNESQAIKPTKAVKPDPNRAIRPFAMGGLSAVAGKPKTFMEAQTLKEQADMINDEVPVAPEVPVRDTGIAEPPEPPKAEEPKPLTALEKEQKISSELESRIAEINKEPISLASRNREIAQLTTEANTEVKKIKAEEKLRVAEEAKLGKKFTADKFTAKLESVNDIMEKQGVDINVAEGIYNRQVTELSKLDPASKESYNRIISRYDDPEFEQEDAYRVAIAEYEQDGIDIDDADKAFNAVASRFGKNFAIDQQTEYQVTDLGIDRDIAEGNATLTKLRKFGDSILAGTSGTARDTQTYLSSLMKTDLSLIPDAIDKIIASPTSSKEAREQALEFDRDFRRDVGTDIGVDEEFLTEAKFKAGLGTAEQRAQFRSGTVELEQLKSGAGQGGLPLSPQTIAQNIMSGVGDTKDVLTKNRQPVLAELNKLKNEAMASGDLSGVLRASAVHGDKNPSDTFLSSFSKGRSVISQLGELKKLMFSEGYKSPEGEDIDLKPLSGWLAEKNPWDTDAQKIKAILQQTIPNLARGVFGEVGVLTDRDVELYRKTLPNLKSTAAVQQAVLGITLKAVQKSLENQIETQALGGRNMSRFVTAYDDIVAKTDELMGLRDLPQGIEETFKNATPKEQEAMIDTAKNSFFKVQKLRELKTNDVKKNVPERNNNPINIKAGGISDQFAEKNPNGTPKTDAQGHLIFSSPEAGVQGAKEDLKAKVEGRSKYLPDNPTISELGKVFAEDPNWGSAVASILGVDVDTKTQDIDFETLFRAVTRQEGGQSLINNA